MTRGSHIGGANQTPDGVPGSMYPSTARMHGGYGPWVGGEMGAKLYPYTQVHILGKPLFARASSSFSHTPPS